MRTVVVAGRRAIVLLLVVAAGVLGLVAPGQPARAAAGDPVTYAYDADGRLVGCDQPGR